MIELLKKNKWYFIGLFGIIVVALVGFNMLQRTLPEPEQEVEIQETEEIPEFDSYGIALDYETEILTVKRGQTLSHLLGQYDISAFLVDDIVSKMQELFDPRKIKIGNSYTAYLDKSEADSVADLKYFVYDISSLEYFVIDFSDSIDIRLGEKEVTIKSADASGIIESSLWVTLTSNNLHPELAIRMSEVLAWEVDFYRIHAGDRFKVIYDEKWIEDEMIGIGDVHALFFSHQSRDVYGFRFVSDSIDGYFNQDGDNLRKVFLKAPLKFGRISSGFSHNRKHPILKVNRPHYGTDYAAPTGTPIYAVGDGVVTQAHFSSGNGNFVKLRHNSVYETQYLHMSKFAKGIKPGVRVKQGDVIGYVGMTGLATGPHVCFRFWKNGKQVNHLREEFPSADPLHEDFYEEFFVIRDRYINKLNDIDFKEETSSYNAQL